MMRKFQFLLIVRVRIYREIYVEYNFCVIMPPPRGLFHAPLRHDNSKKVRSCDCEPN